MASLLFIFIVLTVTCLSIIDECKDFSEKVLISIIYFATFVAVLLFVKSELVCNLHMKAYEEGKLEKAYTIKGTDTTYKWVYHEED